MDFIYDNTGKPYAMWYGGDIYYYVLNLQGDVISIVTRWGESYGSYTYDAWGNVLSVSGDIANLNPIRYRGYCYDSETGLYYLGSRYYDPQVRRFINADGAVFATINPYGEGLTDKNYFAYCDNDPVNRSDDGGQFWNIVAGAAVGGILSASLEIGRQIISGNKSIDWGSVGIEAANGALTGGLMASGVAAPVVTAGRALINGATSASHVLYESKGKDVGKAAWAATVSASTTLFVANVKGVFSSRLGRLSSKFSNSRALKGLAKMLGGSGGSSARLTTSSTKFTGIAINRLIRGTLRAIRR